MNLIDIARHLSVEKNKLIDILPSQFKKRMESNSFISGGCIYSLYNDQEPKDYDFFLKDKELADELILFFKTQELKSFKNLLQGKYNELAITLSKYAISIGNKYQIVTKYIWQPSEVVEQFDFKHNMFYHENGVIYNGSDCSDEKEYLATNRIYFNDGRVRDICGTILRIPKFSRRGMIITKKEVAKMLAKLQDIGFDSSEQEIIRDYCTY